MKCVIIYNPADDLSTRLMDESVLSCKSFGVTPNPFVGTFGTTVSTKLAHYNLKPSMHKLEPRNGESGCFISHYELWLQCVAENQNYMILEHDVIMKLPLPNNILNQFDEVLNLDPCGALQKDQTSYINCSTQEGAPMIDILPTPTKKLEWKTAKQYHIPGAYAYIIKPNAAKKLIHYADTNGYLPVDVHINSYYTSISIITPSIFKICDFMLDRKNRVKYSSTKRG